MTINTVSSVMHFAEEKMHQIETNLPWMINVMLPFWGIFFW